MIFVFGCDGYIGNALTQRLLAEGKEVIGFDNFWRREWIEGMGSMSATPLLDMNDKAILFNDMYDGTFSFEELDIECEPEFLENMFKDFKPDIVINLAHNPSGPYSMKSRKNAEMVLSNNYLGTNNILWTMREVAPECHYITIGTTGEYDHYSNIDIEEGYFTVEHKGRQSNEMIYPRRPGSIYHCCYDDKTELLTENGWKLFKDLKQGEKVATLDKENDLLEYQRPTNVFSYDYEGDMIGIRNKSIDLLVTPNHKIFEHSNHDAQLDRWRLTEAKDIYEKNCSMKRNVNNWNGYEKEYFILPSCKVKTSSFSDMLETDKKIKMENWLNFFGWWLTEGNVYKNRVQILQKKDYNFKEIMDSFYNLQLNRKLQTDRQYEEIIGFSIKCSQLSQYLSQFGISKDRFIPKEIKNLSKKYLMILIDAMLKGDGTINDKSKKFLANFYTQSKQLADDFQEILIKCGFATCLYEPDRSNNDEYVVRLSENNTTQLIISESVQRQKPLYYKSYYENKVYCCEVPNSIILVRRNGKVVWSGNSKTASTYLIDYLTRAWNLKCTDVQQSIVFGVYTDEIDKHKIYSRLDSDEAGGTVINRFVMQAVLGVPLTIYGQGDHQRGFLSLNDSVQALMIAVNNPAQAGSVQVWNQLSEWHSMNDIANMVGKVANDFGIEIQEEKIDTPRVEYTGEHYYHYVTDKLRNLNYKPTRTIEEEIDYMFRVLLPMKDELFPLEAVVEPKIIFNNR